MLLPGGSFGGVDFPEGGGMSTGDVVYLCVAWFVAMTVCSLPALGGRRGAGPRYRAALVRYLVVGWAAAALATGWLALGWFALDARGQWFGTYRDLTLVLMGAFPPLLYLAIRAGNRALAAAQAADRAPAG